MSNREHDDESNRSARAQDDKVNKYNREKDCNHSRNLFGLNVVQTILAVAIAVGTLFSAVGVYIVLPKRVSDIEVRAATESASRAADHDLLIRISEQLRLEELDRVEMKQDIKSMRKEPN
jgi:hypothetical protein